MSGRIGRQENIRCITPVDIKGKDGEALCLAYKTTTFNVIAGVHLKDDGYVLAPRSGNRFYPLTAEEIAAFQHEGTLPDPLPPYRIPVGDYVEGYLLFILLLAMGVFAGVKALWRRFASREALFVTGSSSSGTDG